MIAPVASPLASPLHYARLSREELTERILRRKQELNAVILGHNYQRGEIQDVSDFVGDSLGLSQTAADTEADVIMFCGVHFMAETAKILSPQKKVLMPDLRAGCPMADFVTGASLRQLKAQHPTAAVVTYVNSTAEVKAETGACWWKPARPPIRVGRHYCWKPLSHGGYPSNYHRQTGRETAVCCQRSGVSS